MVVGPGKWWIPALIIGERDPGVIDAYQAFLLQCNHSQPVPPGVTAMALIYIKVIPPGAW